MLPQTFFLDPDDLPSLAGYLGARGATVVGAEKAGEGNMNCTVRVRTSDGSFILKQSRPWLEKYPQIAAPFDRALAEGRFYRLVAPSPTVAGTMPRLLWTDDEARTVALEDLGAASDFFPLYAREIALSEQTLVELVAFLSALHPLAPTDAAAREGLANHEMRALNHEHIFALPLRAENGLDLDAYAGTPGLADVAASLKADNAYARTVAELGERYLHGSGDSLLHGDFFPGSFLRTDAGVRVIDPEFCFCGDAEYDLGVFAAHLLLAGEPAERAERVLERYRPGAARTISAELARRYAGVEIMRRLIGVAQIPTLRADLARKTAWLELSRRLVLEPGQGFNPGRAKQPFQQHGARPGQRVSQKTTSRAGSSPGSRRATQMDVARVAGGAGAWIMRDGGETAFAAQQVRMRGGQDGETIEDHRAFHAEAQPPEVHPEPRLRGEITAGFAALAADAGKFARGQEQLQGAFHRHQRQRRADRQQDRGGGVVLVEIAVGELIRVPAPGAEPHPRRTSTHEDHPLDAPRRLRDGASAACRGWSAARGRGRSAGVRPARRAGPRVAAVGWPRSRADAAPAKTCAAVIPAGPPKRSAISRAMRVVVANPALP